MRFHDLDLNLLVALDALLAECNTMRAGQRLNLSQSATSSALSRLRAHFDDPLLVQVGRNLVPTPRALELGPEIRAILMQIERRILTKTEFDPAQSDRHCRIMASDYSSMTALGQGLARASAEAPNMRFEILPPGDSPAQTIERGDADLLVMPAPFTAPSHPSEPYFTDRYVCIASADHPEIGEAIGFEQFLSLPHAVVRFAGGRQSTFEDWFLERFGQARTIELVTSSYAALPYFIAGSRRVATIHKRQAMIAQQNLALKLLEPPIEIPPVQMMLQWHRMNDADAALHWLRQTLVEEEKAREELLF